MTAPVGLVMTPMVAGKVGRAFFFAGSNRPSSRSLTFSRSSWARRAPAPAASMLSITI
ncbi:hypothetical protein D3C73_556370 [compost metagenome]